MNNLTLIEIKIIINIIISIILIFFGGFKFVSNIEKAICENSKLREVIIACLMIGIKIFSIFTGFILLANYLIDFILIFIKGEN